jgi:hypothetical protein
LAIEVMRNSAGIEVVTGSGAPPANDHFPNRMNLYYWMPAKSCGS